jgi:hypothetical protein
MNRLSALAATVAVLQSGCSGENGTTGGYAVVDPMPPPAQCLGVAATINASAKWKAKDDGAGFVIEITFGKPGRADANYTPGDPGQTYSGKIISNTLTDGSATVVLEPTAGATFANVSIAATCTQGNGHVSAELNLSSPPSAGAAIPLTLSDTW